MKITNGKGDVNFRKNGLKETRISETKLMWTPGIRPVMIPAHIPRAIANKISGNITNSMVNEV